MSALGDLCAAFDFEHIQLKPACSQSLTPAVARTVGDDPSLARAGGVQADERRATVHVPRQRVQVSSSPAA